MKLYSVASVTLVLAAVALNADARANTNTIISLDELVGLEASLLELEADLELLEKYESQGSSSRSKRDISAILQQLGIGGDRDDDGSGGLGGIIQGLLRTLNPDAGLNGDDGESRGGGGFNPIEIVLKAKRNLKDIIRRLFQSIIGRATGGDSEDLDSSLFR
jgi:hypothetical protein